MWKTLKTKFVRLKGLCVLLLVALSFCCLTLLTIAETRVVFHPPDWEPNTVQKSLSYLRSRTNLLFSVPLISDLKVKPSLAFVVFSAPDNEFKRNGIRDTWAKCARRLGFPVVFFIGRSLSPAVEHSLKTEQHNNGDLLRVDMQESYMNLTLKTMALLHSADETPSLDMLSAQYIVKVDDDVYLKVQEYVSQILAYPEETGRNSLFCHIVPMHPVVRAASWNSGAAFVISREMTKRTLNPLYCSGSIYTFHKSMAKRLLEAAQKMPMIAIEDLFWTGYVREKANLALTQIPGSKTGARNICSYADRNVIMTTTGLDMMQIHTVVHRGLGLRYWAINCKFGLF